MKRILVTGSNGLLGQKLVKRLQTEQDISVCALSQSPNKLSLEKTIFHQVDIADLDAVEKIIESFEPDTIIHTAAMTQVDLCETEKERCLATNVQGTSNLIQAFEGKKAPHFIYISTDFVFDGEEGPYREDAIAPNPVNFYGKSKLEAEIRVQESGMPWSILRTVLVYGATEKLSRSNIALWVIRSLKNNQKIRVVKDQFRTPTLAEDLAEACVQTAFKKQKGIYHISGAERVSIYEFALQIAEVFGLNADLIHPVATAELNEAAKRAPKTGFIIEKAMKDLNYQPHTIKEGLTVLKQQIENQQPLGRNHA